MIITVAPLPGRPERQLPVSDVLAAVEAIRDRADDYQLAADYYHGEVPELFCSEAVRRALRDQVAGFDINLARRAVDAVLDRVRIIALSVPGDESGTRELVDRVWNPNRMGRRSKLVHWGALTHGDYYLTVWDGEDEGTVEMHPNSPLTTRIFYDPENPQVKTHAAKLWAEGRGDQRVYRLNLYYPDQILRRVTTPGSKGDEESAWLPYDGDGQDADLPNPYGEVPVFHFRTAEPYGRPVHRAAFGPQNAITKLSATLMSTVDSQGWPMRYALTRAGEVTPSQMFDDDEDPENGADVIKSGPGVLVTLPGVDKVGEFGAADMDAFLKPLGFYVRAMAASTATPLRFFDPQGQIPSGEALRGDEAPLAARITDFEELAEEEWQAVLLFATRVIGVTPAVVDVKWAPVQTVEDLQGWQTVQAKQAAGVPARQALTEAGYTSELVEGWLDGSDASNLATRLDALGKVGDAMQKLGSAVSLGALDKGQVDTILAQVMGELVQDGDEAA
jgi:hypothetical protein